MAKTARLLYGATDIGAPHFSGDILWKTGFRVPDPVYVAEIIGRTRARGDAGKRAVPSTPGNIGSATILFASPLEAGRAEKEAEVDRVVRVTGNATAAVAEYLKKKGVSHVEIPGDFPYAMAEKLKHDFSVAVGAEPWFPMRAIKIPAEIREIEKAQRATERAFDAVAAFLRECRVKGDLLYRAGRPATSEMARKIIDDALWGEGFLATDTIVASGVQAADPHCIGRGTLQARVPIVIDIFPVSLRTHYFADMTRTVFRGMPADGYIKMYEAVLAAQESAIKKIRPGADGKEMHDGVRAYFSGQGFETKTDGRISEGFIHGLGHGVGIDIHEHPRLGGAHDILQEGNVVTVEPGLYYPRAKKDIPAGGIRLEDMVLVTKKGGRNLMRAKKNIASAIIT